MREEPREAQWVEMREREAQCNGISKEKMGVQTGSPKFSLLPCKNLNIQSIQNHEAMGG